MLEQKVKAGKAEALLAAAMCCAAAAFGFYRMRYGLGLSDEGHMLAAPLRYALGDLPFRDEVLNPLRWFDILMSPAVAALPESGGLLWLRAGTLVVNMSCLMALLFAVRRSMPLIALAGIFFAAIYSNFWTAWTPTYHTALADFMSLSAALWIIGAEAKGARARMLLGAAAGVAFFFAAMCELPAAAMLAVPAAFAAFAPKRRDAGAGLCASSIALICSATLLIVSAFVALIISGLAPDLLEALKIQRTIEAYKGGSARFMKLWSGVWFAAPYCAGHAAAFCLVFWLFRRGRRGGAIYYAAGAAAVAVYMAATSAFAANSFGPAAYSARNFGTPPVGALNYLEGFILFSLAAYPLYLAALRKRGRASGPRPALAQLFWLGAALHILLGAICATGLTAASLVTFPIHFIALAMMTQDIWNEGAEGGRRVSLYDNIKLAAPALSLCGVFAAFAFTANMFEMETFGRFWNYDAEFKTEKLRGIRQKADFVAGADAVADYLAPRLKRGDFLLSFYDCPMLNYLTDTRAPLQTGYVSRNFSDAARREFIKVMVERGREPGYAVSCGPVFEGPEYSYVRERFRPVVRYAGFYVVWERR